jgi:plastocyanin
MNKTTKIVAAFIIVIILGAGAYWLIAMRGNGSSSSTASTNQNTKSTATTPSTSSTDNAAPVAATITYTDNGFSPANTTVKSGDSVRITNKSSQPLQMDSDPHPVHTDDEDLNVGEVAPGESKTFTVTKKGNFGIHNHLDPSMTAKIDVQ